MPFGRKSPLEALALPGVILAYKYSQFRQRRREAASRRVTERELSALHHKIDKLLSKLEESEPDPPTSQEDECVICINARATMQTSPCGHRVVCRRCFVKTIQSAVAQRLLPLRCVICRARVNRLTSSSGTWRIQESASSYSMGAKSWASAGVAAGGLPGSASSYSMGDTPHSGHHHHASTFHMPPPAHGGRNSYPRSPNGRVNVKQSASLYSMSSTGSSSLSAAPLYSKTSSISSGLSCSPATSPLSPSSLSYSAQHTPPVLSNTNNNNNNLLAPPTPSISPHSPQSSSSPSACSATGSGSGFSGGSLSPRDLQPHSHHAGCPSGCSGAVPRKPLHSLSNSSSSGSCSSAGSGCGGAFPFPPPPTHTYPGRRHTKGRLVDLQNRLPPIKEFRSPAKVPHPSPVHISNPRFRYSSYTKSAETNSHEMAPLLRSEPASPPRRPMNIQVTTALTTLGPPPLKAGGAKISPMTSKNSMPKNAYMAPKAEKKASSSGNLSKSSSGSSNRTNNNIGNIGVSSNKKLSLHDLNANAASMTALSKGSTSSMVAAKTHATQQQHHTSSSSGNSSRSFPLFSNSSNHKEKADNKKNESVERKKKEEKLKLKAEKEARKEEKRLVKEEERLAKLLAKEEKKKGKKEAKELLLANDGNNKKTNNNIGNIGVSSNKKLSLHDLNANAASMTALSKGSTSSMVAAKTHAAQQQHHTSSSSGNSSRSFPLFSNSSNHKEKADNKKNESVERKKKEEKLKLKAEKEARKEEKRLVKEEERLAKLLAKEEKKKGKKEAKELLLANDGNNKK